ncbi:MAG: reverse transcriptase domain-containing protein [Patescibacteria group bacterium]|jgi:hypothetical protein|nr:reverse transcriptase domain-containing protein [Patescibacteria group bacterium]MDD5172825.1 reverse transcriptase domain-containing protein [Patescibacteria group bacterium]
MKLFEKIIDIKNIRQAYLDLAKKFDQKSLTARYVGIEGLGLNDVKSQAEEFCQKARKELIEITPLAPAICHYIPKKDGSLRDIYVYSVRARIKAQAIYRVLEPIFENLYSPYLFSYRSSHSSFYASRSVARRYQRYYDKDFILIADLKNYSDYIDQDILITKLEKTISEKPLMEILKLFIKNAVYKDKKIYQPKIGVIQGVPLIALFTNLYLDDLDKYLGPKICLYRRIGDDLIAFDPSLKKLKEIEKYLYQHLKELKLEIKKEKTRLINGKEKFNFLGYCFHDRLISLEDSFVKKTISYWRTSLLSFKPKNKMKHFSQLLYKKENSLNNQLLQIISQKILVNDEQQIKNLSETFFRIITKYFYGSYSPRLQKKLKKDLKNIKIPSLYKYYLEVHHGRKKLSDLFVSTKGKN